MSAPGPVLWGPRGQCCIDPAAALLVPAPVAFVGGCPISLPPPPTLPLASAGGCHPYPSPTQADMPQDPHTPRDSSAYISSKPSVLCDSNSPHSYHGLCVLFPSPIWPPISRALYIFLVPLSTVLGSQILFYAGSSLHPLPSSLPSMNLSSYLKDRPFRTKMGVAVMLGGESINQFVDMQTITDCGNPDM